MDKIQTQEQEKGREDEQREGEKQADKSPDAGEERFSQEDFEFISRYANQLNLPRSGGLGGTGFSKDEVISSIAPEVGEENVRIGIEKCLEMRREIKKKAAEKPAINLENYVILEGRTHEDYSYPDTLVFMAKRHYGKNKMDAYFALARDSEHMLTIRQFVDFLILLKGGKVFDGRGVRDGSKRVDFILNEILSTKVQQTQLPWSGEWLDAEFEKKRGFMGIGAKLHINYGYRLVNGVLKPQYSEKISDCLRGYSELEVDYGHSRIDMLSWIVTADKHGLPRANGSHGEMDYIFPREKTAAAFCSQNGETSLCCSYSPGFRDEHYGVRPARLREQEK